MLKIEHVTKKFGDFTAVNDLSLRINKGEVFGIVGANGAGKTTTFRMILGLLEPTEGMITWNGEKINYETSRIIGYLPEERGLYPKLTVKEQLLYFARLRGMKKQDVLPKIDYWLDRFHITQYKNKKAGELSKGNQQKIQFIYSVLHEPELLILDEPFSGLDPINVELLKSAVAEVNAKGTTILFSSHRMEHVEEMCQEIAMFKKGRAIEKGKIREIKQKYGKKFLSIHSEDDLSFLKEHKDIDFYEKTLYGVRIKMNDEKNSQNLIKEALDHAFIRKFEVEEPTLNEIFIQKVGEKDE
jgi:ABC-2 type transport system ATP-binding protein